MGRLFPDLICVYDVFQCIRKGTLQSRKLANFNKHMMPDLGCQLNCTLYAFIVLGKIMYSNIFYGIFFYCIVVILCSNILLF